MIKYVCPNCGAVNPDIMERTIQNYVIDTPLIINSPTDIDYDYDNIQKENVGDDGTVEWICRECDGNIPAYNDGELEEWLKEQEEEHGV